MFGVQRLADFSVALSINPWVSVSDWTGNGSPLCHTERMLSTANSVGMRIGDNYDWSYTGFLKVTNSLVLYNYRDLFLKTWNSANGSSWDTNSPRRESSSSDNPNLSSSVRVHCRSEISCNRLTASSDILSDPGLQARRLDFEQRDEAVHLGLLRGELRQNPGEPERIVAQLRSRPVVSGGRRVALIEDEVDHIEHRRQPGRAVVPARDLEGNARLAQRPLGPDDALGNGRFGDEKGSGDLVGR